MRILVYDKVTEDIWVWEDYLPITSIKRVINEIAKEGHEMEFRIRL